MNIAEFAKKPQLLEIHIDDEAIVAEYGEPITFWMMDYVDVNTYFDFFKSQTDGHSDQLNTLLRKIILNKEGKSALADDEALPIDISIAALTKINETLGKSKTKSSTQAVGIQQD
jgi:hypothetical protein